MLAASMFTLHSGFFARVVENMMSDTNPNWDFDAAQQPVTKSDPQIDPYAGVLLHDNNPPYLHTIHEELEEEDNELAHYNSFDSTEDSDEKATIRRVSSPGLATEVENEGNNEGTKCSCSSSSSYSLASNRRSSVGSEVGLPEMQALSETTVGQQTTTDEEVSYAQSPMEEANRFMEEVQAQTVYASNDRNDVLAPHDIFHCRTDEQEKEETCVSGADLVVHTMDPTREDPGISWRHSEPPQITNMGALASDVGRFNRSYENPLHLAVTMAEYICTRSSDSQFNEPSSQEYAANFEADTSTRSSSSHPVSVDDRRDTVPDAFPAIVFDSPYHSEVGSASSLPTNTLDQTLNLSQRARYSVSLKPFELPRSHSIGELQASVLATQAPERFFSASDVSDLASVSLPPGVCAPPVSRRERSASQPPGGRTTAPLNVGERDLTASRHNTQATSPTETQIHNLTEWLFSPTPSPQVFSEGEANPQPLRACQHNNPEAIAEFFSTRSGLSLGPSELADTNTWDSVQGLETGLDYDYEEEGGDGGGQSESSVPLHFAALNFPLPCEGPTLVTNSRAEYLGSHSLPRGHEADSEPVTSVQYDHHQAGQLDQPSHNMVCFALLPTQASQMKRSPAVQGVCALLHRPPSAGLERLPTVPDAVMSAASGYGPGQYYNTPDSHLGGDEERDDRTSLNSTSPISSVSETASASLSPAEEPPMKRPSYDYGEEEMGEKEMDWFILREAAATAAAAGGSGAQSSEKRQEKKENRGMQAKALAPKPRPDPKLGLAFWRFHRGLWCKSRRKDPRLQEGIEIGQLDAPVLVWQDACEKTVAPARPDPKPCDSGSISEQLDGLPFIDNEEFYSENWYVTDSQQFSWIERAQLATPEDITLYSARSTDTLADSSPTHRFKFFPKSSKLGLKRQKQIWSASRQIKIPHRQSEPGAKESPPSQKSWWARACGTCSCLSAQQDNSKL